MISVKNLYLRYPLMQHNSHSLRAMTKEKFKFLFGKSHENNQPLVKYVDALHDLNFFLPNHSRLGVIGPNGAGKTSLLRVLSGIYPPTKGEVAIEGKVSSLTDFSLGMDDNLTGRKNIIFRLVCMGCSFGKAKECVEDIIEFSGLREKIDMPVYTYSTGMFLRLAFAISTHFSPEILVLDEVIGAGDEAFREKALKRTETLLANSKIVVLSSHDLGAIEKYCTTAIFMNGGRIIASGAPVDVIKEYKIFSGTQK